MDYHLSPNSTGRTDGAWKQNFLKAALLVALALFAYWPALRGGFIIDDSINVTKPELRSLVGLTRIWFDVGATQQYYPVLYTCFWLEHRLWGDATIGYHLINLIQHLVSAGLLLLLVRKLSLPGAWLAAFVFALHPICLESVAWVAEQKNTLSTVWFLSAGLVYLHFDIKRKKSLYFLALAFFILALLTKTVTATLPAALLVVLWWLRGPLSWRQTVLPLMPWILLGASAGLFSAWVERHFVGAQGEDFTLVFSERILVASRALWFYLGKLLWPSDLIFMYPRWTVSTGTWWQWLFPFGAIGVGAICLLMARHWRGPLASFLLFAGLSFPTAGFLDIYWFKISFVADHFAYLPSLTIVVPICATFAAFVGRYERLSRMGLLFSAVLVAALGFSTRQRSSLFADHQTLCERTLAQNPNAWMMHNNLGYILGENQNQIPEAIEHFQAAVRLKPNFADAHFNLGRGWERLPNHLADAITEYQEALGLQPRDVDIQFRLGCALANYGRLPEAIEHFQAALSFKPDHAEAHFNLALALGETSGDKGERVAHLQAAINSKPDYIDAYLCLGNALAESGRLEEALRPLRQVLDLSPDSVEAHFNLGCVLTDLQRTDEALVEFENVLRLQPGFEPALQMKTRIENDARLRHSLPASPTEAKK